VRGGQNTGATHLVYRRRLRVRQWLHHRTLAIFLARLLLPLGLLPARLLFCEKKTPPPPRRQNPSSRRAHPRGGESVATPSRANASSHLRGCRVGRCRAPEPLEEEDEEEEDEPEELELESESLPLLLEEEEDDEEDESPFFFFFFFFCRTSRERNPAQQCEFPRDGWLQVTLCGATECSSSPAASPRTRTRSASEASGSHRWCRRGAPLPPPARSSASAGT